MQALFGSSIIPLTAGFVFLLIAAYCELKTFKVPNKLTFGAMGIALVFGLIKEIAAPGAEGGVGTLFVGALVGGGLLIPFYAIGLLGAGCAKAQAAFGAWIGVGVGLSQCLVVVALATIIAMFFATVVLAYIYFLRDQASTEPGKYDRIIHGQLPLSIGTMLGLVAAVLI